MFFGLVLLFLSVQAAKPAPIPGMPAAAGVYFRQDGAQWIKLEPAAMADMKSKGMGDFLNTDGYTNLDVIVAYQGAQAKLQITAQRPTFYVRGVGSPNEAMIVRLTGKKDNRTVKTASSAATAENKGGFRKEEIEPVAVTIYADDSFSVAPEQDLKPGEYLLAFSYPSAGFDFGVNRAKK